MGEAITYLWFALAILIEVVSSFVLWVWLRRRGVKLVFGMTGIPGYLESTYHKWCKSHQRSGTGVLLFRVASIVNVIVAAIIAIPLLIAR